MLPNVIYEVIMAKESPLTDSRKVKKILVGITIGLFVGLVLECLKTLWMSWRPWTWYSSIFISLPSGTLVAVAGIIGCCIGIGAAIREYTRRCLVSKFEHLPICAADFITFIIKKMRYRRKVRADVQAELAGHFEDGLKDCKSDEEKEQRAKRLIEDFGDVKLLAVLLRRAKKRCRPLWRKVFARTFQTIGVLILCLSVYLVWFLTGKPVVIVDYVAELNRIVRPVADESLNATPFYHRAAELFKKLPDNFFEFLKKYKETVPEAKWRSEEWEFHRRIFEYLSEYHSKSIDEEKKRIEERIADLTSRLLSKKYNEVTPAQKQLIEKWLESNNEALELVIAGSKKPYYWPKYETGEENTGEMMAVLLPHLSEFRKLVYALRWRAWLSVEDGRYEDAFSDIKTCYRFGKHIKSKDTFLIEQLVGIAFESLTVRTLRSILSEHKIDSTKLVELQQDFERMTADENFTLSLKFEKLCMYDAIQRCFTEDRLGGGHLSLDGLRLVGSMTDSDLFEFVLEGRHWTTPLHILFTHPNKRESREMTDSYYEFWDEIVHKTPAQTRAEGIDIEKEAMEIIKDNLLLDILTPALGRINEISHLTKAEVEVTLTIIAILRYRQDTSDYPQNLQELVAAGYLKKIPLDPFSDRPLIYKKTDEDFILYSFGYDFDDDGGQVYRDGEGRVRPWGDEGDEVFWPVPKSEIKK